MAQVNWKQASKVDWSTTFPDGKTFPGIERVNAGSLMRIADATEVIANNYGDLIAERNRYERWYNEQRDKVKRLEKSNAALRGVISRMKKIKQP